jgi:aryl-alcohol dehydrogenase-like predicted oxidoreductase
MTHESPNFGPSGSRLVRLGSSEIEVTRLAIGCNSFGRSVDGRTAQSIVGAALDNGVNFFDTADVYGNPHGTAEELLGNALYGERSRAVIATKFGFPMSSGEPLQLPSAHGTRSYIFSAVDASLERLRSDYVDLLQIHIPDPATPTDETAAAFETLLTTGKVRAVGVSRYSVHQLRELIAASSQISSVQSEYSLLCADAEDTLLPVLATMKMAFLACLPLASGLLTGKYDRSTPVPPGSRLDDVAFAEWHASVPWQRLEYIRDFARRRSLSMLSVAIGYLLCNEGVTSVITGVTSAQQVIENIRAADWRPDVAEMFELRDLAHQQPGFPARVPWERAGKW